MSLPALSTSTFVNKVEINCYEKVQVQLSTSTKGENARRDGEVVDPKRS